jgi:ribose transport system ATP-binding protein
MRDGRRVATHNTASVTPGELVLQMVGHDLPERKVSVRRGAGQIALSVQNLCSGERVQNVSFEVRNGEILGLAGLIGSGRTETLRAIFGADAKDTGEILLNGKPVSIRSPAEAVRAGIGLVPEDRKQHGLLLPQSVQVNTTLATLPRHTVRAGWLDAAAETETANSFCRRLSVRCASLDQPVGELSGGNQQKIVIARWLARDCAVLLFDEPTRGIDASAKDLVCQLLRDLAGQGKAVVVVSSELPELMAISDRILVMSLGRIVAEFLPDEWSQEAITRAAFSGHLDSKGQPSHA